MTFVGISSGDGSDEIQVYPNCPRAALSNLRPHGRTTLAYPEKDGAAGNERAREAPAHCRIMTAASIRVKSPGAVRREMMGPEFRSVFAGEGGWGRG
jgi:hypothetical protein